ncbi:MAG: phage/plasmid replication protein [Fusobacterium sp.]|uniref:phage/plasmid replication domain-containing protein n=1 Tax=Fusobacterium sp. TaxID=68766 RepID=UPI002A75FBA0|nr:phage/plasmid replication protein [Fusobacterium sp.]MDY2980181.1 phage/plasmid replication protein [Fusobacterium sp.]
MLVDTTKLEKVGIDRIVLNNFQILNFDELDKETKYTANNEIVEKIEYIEYGIFSLSYTKNSKGETGETYHFSSLELNPSKLKNGHNIYNANLTELRESLEIVLKKLESVGIKLDITEAKIKEVEIDMTLVIDFEELQEVILLIGRANYKKALVISSFRNEDIPQKLKRDRTLYLNSKVPDVKKGNTGKIIKFYDKTFELYIRQGIKIDKELMRIEVLFGQDYFRNIMERIGLDNSLKTFLMNNVLEDIFIKSLTNELLIKPKKYIEKIKKKLNYDFNNFRRNENVKREYRKRYIEQGKEIPEAYKEERGVFKYLKNNSWIFDFSFLLEVVNKNIISRHRQNFEKQILKNYTNITNLSIYNFLIKKVFGEFFLPH